MIRTIVATLTLALTMPAFGQERPAPAANLRLHVAASNADAKDLLDAKPAAWNGAKPTAILLNRTPRIYQTEPTTPRPAPKLEAQSDPLGRQTFHPTSMGRCDQKRTAGAAQENGRRRRRGENLQTPDRRNLSVRRCCRRHDAAECEGRFSIAGDGRQEQPGANLLLERIAQAQELASTGRAMQKPIGREFPHHADQANGKWTVVLQLPEQPDGCPVAFAIWDGEHQDRDGLKFFSIWYVLTNK